MSKVIVSPVKRYPGTVTLADPLDYPQAIEIERAYARIQELGDNVTRSEQDAVLLPAIFSCVEGWNLENVPSEMLSRKMLPATPKLPAAQLAAWLAGAIADLYREAEDIPNE